MHSPSEARALSQPGAPRPYLLPGQLLPQPGGRCCPGSATCRIATLRTIPPMATPLAPVLGPHGLWVRPGTDDDHIAAEALSGAWSELAAGPGDVVADLGGNIGSAARAFLAGGAAVVSVEADSRNAEVFARNAPGATLLLGAVRTGAGTVTFHRATDGRLWHQGLDWFPGSEPVSVDAYDFEALLAGTCATIVKCDIEGGEYHLRWDRLPAGVRAVGIEVHDVVARADDVGRLRRSLSDAGFEFLAARTHPSRPVDEVWIAVRSVRR